MSISMCWYLQMSSIDKWGESTFTLKKAHCVIRLIEEAVKVRLASVSVLSCALNVNCDADYFFLRLSPACRSWRD